MHFFAYRDGRLFAEETPLEEIARKVGTPFYCYSCATLERHYRAFEASLGNVPHLICFSVKSTMEAIANTLPMRNSRAVANW